MSRPVIAMVTDAIAPYHKGGKEQRYEALAPRLAQHADVHIYTMKWWAGPRLTTRRGGVTYHAISPHLPLYRGKRRSIAQALMFALASLRMLFVPFDVMEADHMPYIQLFVLKLVAAVRRKPLVVTWHEVWDRRRWTRYLGAMGAVGWSLEQLAMRVPDCIMADTPHVAELLRRRVRDRVPIVMIPVGIDLPLISRTPAAADAADVISVGRLLSHKRFDLLLDSIALLSRAGQPLRCCIVGDGPERERLLAHARRLGIDHLVDFRHGIDEHEELLSLVKAAGAFVFPSEREGFGIAALEAIACGVPVITTTAPDNLARHLVARSAQGTLCEPTAESVAAAIAAVRADDRDGRQALDRQWLREYDWDTIALAVGATLAGRRAGAAHPVMDGAGHPVTDGAGHPVMDRAGHPVMARGAHPATAPPIAGGAHPPAKQVTENGAGTTAVRAGPRAEPAAVKSPADRSPPSRSARPGRRRPYLDLAVSVLAVAVMAALAHVRGVWILQGAEFFLLLVVPGTLLVRALRVSPGAVTQFPLYVLCSSLGVLMVSGLGADLIGPLLGVSRPLTTTPLALSLAAACLVLIAVSAFVRPPSLRDYLPPGGRIWTAWPLVLPVLAWIGAERLTNGHGTGLAIAAVACSGAALVAGGWLARRGTVAGASILLYGASLALMWSFSLRGHYVYGYDIATEYQKFLSVLQAGRWHPPHPNDPYGAMLSLTILPSSLARLTGASSLLVFKAIYPALFAFFPVGVFLLATRVVSRRFAYLGALFVVVQNYFFQQQPAIARQEIGLIFFVSLVAALFDTRMRRRSQYAMLVVLGGGLLMAHYGTAYLTIAFLAVAVVVEPARRRLARRLGSASPGAVALTPLVVALAVCAGGAAIWYVPVTNSAQNVSGFFSDLGNQGLSVLPSSGGKNIVQAYLSGNVPTQVSGAKFSADAHKDFEHRSYITPLPQAFLPANRLVSTTVPGDGVKSQAAVSGLNAEQVLLTQIGGLLAVVGAFLLWWRRSASDPGRTIGLLAVSTLIILVAIRFSGTAALAYNQGRAFLQALVPLAVCLAWVLQEVSAWRRGRAIPGVFAIALALMLVNTSGLRGTIAGGGTPTNLATSGEDFDRFYFTQPEFAAARWLNAQAPPGDIVSTDRYGYLRLLDATGRTRSVFPVITPSTLDHHAWIYADTANFVGHQTRGQEGNDVGLYAWPSFIQRYWNLAYTNGSSAVYVRTH